MYKNMSNINLKNGNIIKVSIISNRMHQSIIFLHRFSSPRLLQSSSTHFTTRFSITSRVFHDFINLNHVFVQNLLRFPQACFRLQDTKLFCPSFIPNSHPKAVWVLLQVMTKLQLFLLDWNTLSLFWFFRLFVKIFAFLHDPVFPFSCDKEPIRLALYDNFGYHGLL